RYSKLTRWTCETEWCAASELRAGDRIVLNDHRSNGSWGGEHTHEEGYLIGLLMGDGTLKSDTAVLSVWGAAAAANGPAEGIAPGVRQSWPRPFRRRRLWRIAIGRTSGDGIRSAAERSGGWRCCRLRH